MAAALTAAGARVVAAPGFRLQDALTALFGAGVMSIVIEGGAALHRAAVDEGVADAVHLYLAPALLGPGAVDWIGARRLAWDSLERRRAGWLDEVLLVEGYVHRTG